MGISDRPTSTVGRRSGASNWITATGSYKSQLPRTNAKWPFSDSSSATTHRAKPATVVSHNTPGSNSAAMKVIPISLMASSGATKIGVEPNPYSTIGPPSEVAATEIYEDVYGLESCFYEPAPESANKKSSYSSTRKGSSASSSSPAALLPPPLPPPISMPLYAPSCAVKGKGERLSDESLHAQMLREKKGKGERRRRRWRCYCLVVGLTLLPLLMAVGVMGYMIWSSGWRGGGSGGINADTWRQLFALGRATKLANRTDVTTTTVGPITEYTEATGAGGELLFDEGSRLLPAKSTASSGGKGASTPQPPSKRLLSSHLIDARSLLTLMIAQANSKDAASSVPNRVCLLEVTTSDVERSRREFRSAGHIPSARLMRYPPLAHNGVPVHPLQLQRQLRALGVDSDCHVVLYDRGEQVFATYAYWILRLYGHSLVSVLDGGWERWLEESARHESAPYRIEMGAAKPIDRQVNFKAEWNPQLIATFDDVLGNFHSGEYDLVDAQTEAEYNGQVKDVRGKSQAAAIFGHIRSAVNIPVEALYNYTAHEWLDQHALRAAFDEKGLPNRAKHESDGNGVKRPLIIYDGTSLRSTLVWLAAQKLGIPAAVYFGSWPEWLVRAPDYLKVIPTREI